MSLRQAIADQVNEEWYYNGPGHTVITQSDVKYIEFRRGLAEADVTFDDGTGGEYQATINTAPILTAIANKILEG